MMEHSEIQDKLELYIKRDLEPELFNEVSHHLDGCRLCSLEHETLQQYFIALENLETVNPPPNFLGSIYKKIGTKSTAEKIIEAITSPFNRSNWRLITSLVATCIILGVILTVQQNRYPAYQQIEK